MLVSEVCEETLSELLESCDCEGGTEGEDVVAVGALWTVDMLPLSKCCS